MPATLDEGFHALHDQLRPTVRRVVNRVLASPAVAEETVQDVMTEIWVKHDQRSANAQHGHQWASTIARRRSIDRIRSDRAREERERRVQAMNDRAAIEVVAEDVVIRLDGERVRHALADLKPKQREAIVLAFFGGHSYVQVGELLGVPTGTIKRRVRDGLMQLRASLNDAR